MAAGDIISYTAFVREGTSSKFQTMIRITRSAAQTFAYPNLSGEIDNIATTLVDATGDLSFVSNTLRFDGTREIKFTFKANIDLEDIRIGVGPYSTIVGEDIIFCGLDVKEGDVFSSIADGARSSDNMIITSSDLNLDTTEGFAFVKWVEKDNGYSNYPKLLRIFEDGDNQIAILKQLTTGNISCNMKSGGTNVINKSESKPANETINTVGIRWGSGSAAIIINGIVHEDIDAPSMIGFSNISIGCNSSGSEHINSIIQRVVIGETKPSASEFLSIYQEVAG